MDLSNIAHPEFGLRKRQKAMEPSYSERSFMDEYFKRAIDAEYCAPKTTMPSSPAPPDHQWLF